MKKKLLLLLITALITFLHGYSQTISPIETTEFCPLTDITFTESLPRIANGSLLTIASSTNTPIVVSGVNNINHTANHTTFTFVGRFRDVNISQVFRVSYTPNGGSPTSFPFTFNRIKSFFYHTTCSQVSNQATVTVPRCQVINIPVSVSNVQWGTAFESPQLCFGSVSAFEYKLPNGWSIGSNVSNGNNWIAGGGSVTVTTDLSTGDDGNILIRPRNTCGSGLENNIVPGQIPISRPAPNLSITGAQYAICSSNTANFTINGIPSGASVQWSISNTAQASILSGGTSPTVTIKRIGTANTTMVLTATVTHCTFTYTRQQEIALGIPAPNPVVTVLVDPVIGKIQVENAPALPGATYRWYKDGVLVSGQQGAVATIPIPKNVCNVGYGIEVAAVNACGTSLKTYKGVYVPPCDNSFTTSPNPASSEISISANNSTKNIASKTIDEVRIYDQQGNLKKIQKFGKAPTARIVVSDLPSGIYLIEVTSSFYKEKHQVIIRN